MESRAPVRTCLGCRRKTSQADLLRVSRNSSGVLTLTKGMDRYGRGAYVCARKACLDIAIKGDRLARALRKPVTEPEKERLARELEASDRMTPGLYPEN